MKAFEEWWNNILIEHGKTCVKNGWCSDEHYGQEQLAPYKVNYKRGWKAALKQILEWASELRLVGDFDKPLKFNEIEHYINQELAEELPNDSKK